MNRVARQLRIGHVALDAFHFQFRAQRAAAAVLHHVTHCGRAGRLAHDAPGDFLVARFQMLHHFYGAVDGGAFLVAGDQKSDGAAVIRMLCHKAFTRRDHRRQAALHVGGAASAQHAVFDFRFERGVLPALHRSGGYHVGVAGEGQYRAGVAAPGPEIVHFTKAQFFRLETDGRQPFDHQGLAIAVIGCHRRLGNQVDGQLQGGGQVGGGHGQRHPRRMYKAAYDSKPCTGKPRRRCRKRIN